MAAELCSDGQAGGACPHVGDPVGGDAESAEILRWEALAYASDSAASG
jgi:hypothetical protein